MDSTNRTKLINWTVYFSIMMDSEKKILAKIFCIKINGTPFLFPTFQRKNEFFFWLFRVIETQLSGRMACSTWKISFNLPFRLVFQKYAFVLSLRNSGIFAHIQIHCGCWGALAKRIAPFSNLKKIKKKRVFFGRTAQIPLHYWKTDAGHIKKWHGVLNFPNHDRKLSCVQKYGPQIFWLQLVSVRF